MAMKIDRRAFLKTSAAMAVAVSMTGLLGGCSDGAIGTDFGLFQATAVKALGKTNGVDFGLDFTISIQQNLCEIKDLTLVQKMPADAVAAPCTAKIRKNQIARILSIFAATKSPGRFLQRAISP